MNTKFQSINELFKDRTKSKRCAGRNSHQISSFYLCCSILLCGLPLTSDAQTVGVPLGGIGAGSVQIEADGRFRVVAISGAERAPLEEMSGFFAALWTRTALRTTAEVLASTGVFDLPLSVSAPTFKARFPFALLSYPDPARPVSVTLSAFSPLIPYDVRNSSFPGFLITFQLKNETNEPIEVSAALSVENLLGRSRGEGGVVFVSVPAAEGNFGGRFVGTGKSELVVQVQPPRGDALFTQTATNTANKSPQWWSEFAKEGRVSVEGQGNAKTIRITPEARSSVFAVRLNLKPRERIEIPFSVAWNLSRPARKDVSEAFVPTPAEIFPSALLSARELLNQRLSLTALTEEWQSRISNSNLPLWLEEALINSLTPLNMSVIRGTETPYLVLMNGEQIATPAQSRPALLSLDALFPTLLSTQLEGQNLRRNDLSEPLSLLENDKPDLALSLLERNETSRSTEDKTLSRLSVLQILPALWGFQHQQNEITLTPRLPGTWRSLRAPIFAPGFWAYGDFVPRARGYSLSFRLDRTFAVQFEEGKKSKRPSAAPDLTLSSLVLPSPPRVGNAPSTIYARLRQSALGVHVTPLPDNKIRVTFDTPLHLVAGDRIDLEAK